MFWTNAFRIIAVMAHKQIANIFRVLVVGYGVGDTMRSIVFTSNNESAIRVAFRGRRGRPNPALSRFINFRPKALGVVCFGMSFGRKFAEALNATIVNALFCVVALSARFKFDPAC